MASFTLAHKKTSANEGGLANNKVDRGKFTYRGIASVHWPNWIGWTVVRRVFLACSENIEKADKILAADAVLQRWVDDFYKKYFWDVYSLDQVKDQAIAEEMFDTAVNMGVEVEARFLQRALNVTNKAQKLYPNLVVDGVIGPKTIATLNAHPNPKLVLKILNVLQGARYISIMEADESQEIFAISWFSRVTL